MPNVYLDKHISTYTHFLFYIERCGDICHATGMEEPPKVTLDIQCLWRGGGVALTSMIN